ncbi:alcohol dehydrogenase catalytic domain-containing protein [Candidatus Soleaferrea massiliensis]|uniref:alcohol dehydrogenase catalytic domain-containing protein n=1 Tax=Candidatus Soleaferrea massiliensis TaxID=1470354 RepID=UPI00058F0ADD|nr:alcohol dehydrogenase catalytic domain-containing protein [Candidatus Soleaferrea massiliensis]
MITSIYQLVSPSVFSVKYQQIDAQKGVIIRPDYMAICHADQRYYRGLRDAKSLAKKLPMALIHECCGTVVHDRTGTFQPGQRVVMIPNIPGEEKAGIYENYAVGSGFLSSGRDGFMRELVILPPDRVVAYEGTPGYIAAITEFVSVAVHAAFRLGAAAHAYRDSIAIWGDGSLAYVVSLVLRKMYPQSRITVVGLNPEKLSMFTFVDSTYLTTAIPEDFSCDHAFECAGGEGCAPAIENIIAHIRPQGTVLLMGVSENPVPIFTRMVLEKGLTLVGSSRSGRADFEKAVEIMSDTEIQRRLSSIILEDDRVASVSDLHRVFKTDMTTPFKTVFKWNM